MPIAWRSPGIRCTEGKPDALKHGFTTKEQREWLKYANRFWREKRRSRGQ